MIRESNHFVAFTGAGISTAAGIADFRSGANTVMPTGPGAWEKAANIHKAKKEGKLTEAMIKNQAKFKVPSSKAKPTRCHMALVELMRQGRLKHIISQNTDGLHRKSGVPAENISEVHGNTNLEICKKCG